MGDKINLPLRLGVGIILLNSENKVFVGKRIDNPENFWQMPQGGINNNESFFQAAKRELEEETGITKTKCSNSGIECYYMEIVFKIRIINKIIKAVA